MKLLKRIFPVIALLSFLGLTAKSSAHKLDRRYVVEGNYDGDLFGRIRPVNGVTMVYRGVSYYVHEGKYYRVINGRWALVKPSFSSKVRSISYQARRISRGGTTFYAHKGRYYRPVVGGFVCVDL